MIISSCSTKLHIQIKIATISIYLRSESQVLSTTCKGKLRNILCTYYCIIRFLSYSYLSSELISDSHPTIHSPYQALTCIRWNYWTLGFCLPLFVSIGHWYTIVSYQAVYYLILTGWNYGTSCLQGKSHCCFCTARVRLSHCSWSWEVNAHSPYREGFCYHSWNRTVTITLVVYLYLVGSFG